ncbi:hypothetical protein [Novosphingobium sp.]|uniref:hypothetical protein n=1 Tax=Novosphingobium sp. TaxID=1874826 RepID=UPI001D709E10|nr:hypothetical protein [Novosphingobium sp.]MBX9663901.1 hypothetical protein [Novosphingobium sp.]
MTTLPQSPAAFADDAEVLAPVAPPSRSGPMRFAIGAAAIAFFLTLTYRPFTNVSAFLLHRQDRWLLLAAAVLVVLSCVRLSERAFLPAVQRRTWLIVALAMLVATSAGHFLILSGYDLSRDEQMATFDATVFGQGHLVAPVPAFWRDHADVLNTLFFYPAQPRAAWISSYLPLNAALRALFGVIAAPWLVGPFMTALGAVALFGCVRRLWPDDREAGFVALVLYAGSAQVLFAGMTSYAMPGHLALDLCWLWLFLRRTTASDIAALAVGFVATGLHQPLMHPMFVAPFILLLLAERRWHRAALYIAGYAAIGLFWLWWPTWIGSLVQAQPLGPRPEGVDYLSRLITTLSERDPMGLPNMVANGLRFIAWQHLLLVPLLLVGARRYRSDPMIAALAGGMVITVLVMAILLPNQGHGFGYRYLHGLIGNAILLAVYGWKALGEQTGQWRTLLLRTTAAGALVVLPLQAVMAHQFYGVSAGISARLSAIDADYIVLGGKDAATAVDLVHNPPDLSARPVRLLRDELTRASVAAICASHPKVVLIGDRMIAPLGSYYAFGPTTADHFNARVAPHFVREGCRVSRVG